MSKRVRQSREEIAELIKPLKERLPVVQQKRLEEENRISKYWQIMDGWTKNGVPDRVPNSVTLDDIEAALHRHLYLSGQCELLEFQISQLENRYRHDDDPRYC